MKKAKVYFTNMRTRAGGKSLLEKLSHLIRTAGMPQMGLLDKFAAIKIHFGETGNLAFLRPNFARVVVDEVKRRKGKPFLTDCNTLYPGTRKDALEHIETAYQNGFSPYAAGCHIIIGDGLKGTDDVELPVPNGVLLKTAKIGRAVADADVIISLNHFKGHELAGFGGAIKNLGMGCGSRAGKMEQHCDGKPVINQSACIGCGACLKSCAHSAPALTDGKAGIDEAKCVGCGRCIGVCPKDAIEPSWGQKEGLLDMKMAEYAAAVINGKPHFHINIVMDVSPFCDCHGENDTPIVPDIGMFASFDPVAVDQACADAVNAQKPLMNSILGDRKCLCGDHFKDVSAGTNWKLQLEHAEKLGIGTREYELIELSL